MFDRSFYFDLVVHGEASIYALAVSDFCNFSCSIIMGSNSMIDLVEDEFLSVLTDKLNWIQLLKYLWLSFHSTRPKEGIRGFSLLYIW